MIKNEGVSLHVQRKYCSKFIDTTCKYRKDENEGTKTIGCPRCSWINCSHYLQEFQIYDLLWREWHWIKTKQRMVNCDQDVPKTIINTMSSISPGENSIQCRLVGSKVECEHWLRQIRLHVLWIVKIRGVRKLRAMRKSMVDKNPYLSGGFSLSSLPDVHKVN